MENVFIKSAKLQKEFFRISDHIISNSVEKINKKDIENDELVHTLRKRVKNLRTILKLLRKEVGEDFYKKNNSLLRDINRRSSSIRNYFALINLVEHNLNQSENEKFFEALNLLLIRLRTDFDNVRNQTDYSTLFSHYDSQLNKYCSHLKKLKETQNKFNLLKAGFVKIYSEGKELLNICLINSSDDNLHEWRKCSKDYYYITLSLSPIWKPVFEPLAKEIKTLSDMLGQINDYYELSHYIQTLIDNPFDFTMIFDLIDSSRLKLLEDSYKLGKRIYAVSPEIFAEQFKAYYLCYKKD